MLRKSIIGFTIVVAIIFMVSFSIMPSNSYASQSKIKDTQTFHTKTAKKTSKTKKSKSKSSKSKAALNKMGAGCL